MKYLLCDFLFFLNVLSVFACMKKTVYIVYTVYFGVLDAYTVLKNGEKNVYILKKNVYIGEIIYDFYIQFHKNIQIESVYSLKFIL